MDAAHDPPEKVEALQGFVVEVDALHVPVGAEAFHIADFHAQKQDICVAWVLLDPSVAFVDCRGRSFQELEEEISR